MAEWWQRLVAFVIDLVILAVPELDHRQRHRRERAVDRGDQSRVREPRVWEAIGVALW